jgi:hypothetical protein
MLLILVAAASVIIVIMQNENKNSTSVAGAMPERIFDYYNYNSIEELPWEEKLDFSIPEYPETVFTWSTEKITAISNVETRELFTGMPIWSVYLYDLTGDNLPEICSTISYGSGIIDTRIIAYDYKADTLYDLSDRTVYDYSLFIDNQKLVAKREAYDKSNTESSDYGYVVIKDGKLEFKEKNLPE